VIQNLVVKGNLISFNINNNKSAIKFLDYSSNDFNGAIEIGLGVVTEAARALLRWREVLSGGEARETHVEQKDLAGVGMASIADGTDGESGGGDEQ
jgi:hypothetical protein